MEFLEERTTSSFDFRDAISFPTHFSKEFDRCPLTCGIKGAKQWGDGNNERVFEEGITGWLLMVLRLVEEPF